MRDSFQFELPHDPAKRQVQLLGNFLFTYHLGVEKFFKWFYGCGLAYCMDLHKDQVVPFPKLKRDGVTVELGSLECKEVLCLFTGKLRRVMRSFWRRCHNDLRRSGNKRRSTLSRGQTFLMFKKGSPEMSEEFIQQTKESHKACIGKRGRYEGAIKSFPHEQKDMVATVKKVAESIIRKLFRKGSGKVLYRSSQKLPMPSFRAAHGISRSKGGSSRAVKSLVESLNEGEMELVSMDYHPRMGVVSKYKSKTGEKKFFDRVYNALRASDFDTTPVFLQEPLKIRTITKGPPIPYWYMKPMQKFLWRNVSRKVNFRLSGEPVTEQFLNEIFLPRIENNTVSGCQFVSGDYSSATDNMAQWISLHMWNYICEWCGIGPVERRVGAKSLVGHKVHYEEGTMQQWNGQLMGSPLSFPLLCIANAATIVAAYWNPLVEHDGNWADYEEAAELRCRLFDLPFLVNGDDCVMSMDTVQYDSWQKYAKLIGMSPSIGKCYVSPDFLEINSENFALVEGAFKRTPFINLSLASDRTARGNELRPLKSFSAVARSFIKGFGQQKRQKLLSLWIRRMMPALKSHVPSGMSWGIPQWLGGLGLPLQESKFNLSETEQRFASYLYAQHKKGNYLSVLPGKDETQPDYLLKSLRQASDLMIRVPVVEETSKVEGWREPKELDIFGPLIWKGMLTEPGLIIRSQDISLSEKLFLKRFRHLWLKSQLCEDILSKHELLQYKGVRSSPAGGVAEFLERNSAVPKGLYTEISQRFCGLVY
jgi:hypothetical protein